MAGMEPSAPIVIDPPVAATRMPSNTNIAMSVTIRMSQNFARLRRPLKLNKLCIGFPRDAGTLGPARNLALDGLPEQDGGGG